MKKSNSNSKIWKKEGKYFHEDGHLSKSLEMKNGMFFANWIDIGRRRIPKPNAIMFLERLGFDPMKELK